MAHIRLGEMESRFADLIWKSEPLPSRQLAELAAEAFDWKRTTTYTVLKRLCERGLFENDGGTVRALMSREEFYAMQSEQFVEETFDGSLPAFLAAFGSRKKLADDDIQQLQKIIDDMRR